VYGKGFTLRTEERADEALAAFDQALDNMQRQIERYKGKHEHGRGDGRSAAEVAEAAEPIIDDETGELSPLVARKKKFVLYPMNEEEAVIQMRNLGHDNFFIFYNAETSKVNVLYRRRNGSYGLIEPELG
jgi:putative sigma-54 modulation protein